MKIAITSQQLAYFREHGHIRFEISDFPEIKTAEIHDLWRRDPNLLKFLLRTVGPIILELTKKKTLRLACDRWFGVPPNEKRFQDLFCFQGLAVFVAFSYPFTLDIYDPSSLASLIAQNTYVAAFAMENGRFIERAGDPLVPQLKRLGHAFGDLLSNEFHPILFKP